MTIAVAAVMLVSAVPVWSALEDMLGNGGVSFQPYNPYATGGTWYKGQTHVHSTRSDGDLTPTEVVARYTSLGYKFIAITDHHTVTKIRATSLLVLGQEYGKGSSESGLERSPHMNGINISSVYSESASLQARIDSIVSQRGIVTLNHPTTIFFEYSMDDLIGLRNYTALEIYNGESGFWEGNPVGAWDKVLSTGKRVWGVAADDAHQANDYNKGWVEVRLTGKLTTANVLNTIKKGNFYSSTGPTISELHFDGTTFSVVSPDADSISFFGKGGKLLRSVDGGHANYTVDGSEGYVRAEVEQGDKKAWSQPVFIGSHNNTENSLTSDLYAADMEMMARSNDASYKMDQALLDVR